MGRTYIFILPLLTAVLEQCVDIGGLSETDAHDTCGDRLLVVANATFLSKLVRDLFVTEALLTHLHHEFVVRVELVRYLLVVCRQGLALLAVATTKGARNTRRGLGGEGFLVIDDERVCVGRAKRSGHLDTLTLRTRDGIVVLAVVALGAYIILVLVLIFVLVIVIVDCKVRVTLERELIVRGLSLSASIRAP
jgi:hypothetical protein